MKRPFVKLGSVAVIAAASLALGTQAFAGESRLREVEVTRYIDRSVVARGNLSAARFSQDVSQFIGCDTASYGFARCEARDSAGTSVYCYKSGSDPDYSLFHESVNGLSTYSELSFGIYSSGRCAWIRVDNSSKGIRACSSE